MQYNKLLQEVIEEAKAIRIPVSNNIDPTVLINNRAKGRFGQCKRRPTGFQIELSVFLEQADTHKIKETLAHEVLHTCKDCFNHQSMWQYHAAKMNQKYGYNISRTNSCANMGVVVQKERNYVLKCQTCGNEIIRQRASKVTQHPEKFRCGRCHGKLVLI